MSCRFQVFENSFTSARTADSSSALNVCGVFVIAESRMAHTDRAITASIAKAIRFMVNSPRVANVRLARPPTECTRTPPAPLHHGGVMETWRHVQDHRESQRCGIVRTRHLSNS